MSERTRLAIIEAAREETRRNHLLFAGASGIGISQILDNIRDVATAGADVAVLMAPFFFKLTQQQLIDFFVDIADRSALPLAFYHHKNMPTTFAIETVAALAAHPKIIGFKENSGDAERARPLSAIAARENFSIYQGSEPLVLDSAKASIRGCVTAIGNVAPALHSEIYRHWDAGDSAGAEAAQEKLTALWRLFRQESVSRSIGHFMQSLLIPLQEIGVVQSTATLLPGFEEDPDFRREVLEFYAKTDFTPTPAS